MAQVTNTEDFRDARRQQAKACIMLEGLSGKGKSGLALLLAKTLAGGDMQKVYAVDTENKSLDLFEGIRLNTGDICAPFKKMDLFSISGYAPSKYLKAKENAITAGGSVYIADSITHMWQREGGVLDLVANVKGINKWTAWNDPTVKKEKLGILETIRDHRIHVISTVRVKEKHEQVTGDSGKQEIQSIGEQQEQMPDLKYEADLVLHMLKPGNQDGSAPRARVIKSRYTIFEEGAIYEFTENIALQLKAYLEDGADPAILMEQQRKEYAELIKATLDNDVSKATMFPVLKKEAGYDGTALKDLPLNALRELLTVLIN